jgi:AP-3 complex subunit mu
VRHTSNELYVDLVESLSVIIAPSGRPLSAFANGTIAFTAKISGVPDVLLTLSSPSGKHNLESVMELPVFHPCVRLARWREHPGELSFIPPDGRFVLAGYEVNLLPFTSDNLSNTAANLKLPINIEVKTSLGPIGADFEVRLLISSVKGEGNSSSSLSGSMSRGGRIGNGGSGFGGSSSSNGVRSLIEDLMVTVPIPEDVRNVSEIRASRGDTSYNPGDRALEWYISPKEASAGNATLRCTVVPLSDDDEEADGNGFSFDSASKYEYNENEAPAYQSAAAEKLVEVSSEKVKERDVKRIARNKLLMPTSARVSFSVKGWLASGIKVESLLIDHRKSRGLGEGVKPYKGVKYLSVSRGGIEVRC